MTSIPHADALLIELQKLTQAVERLAKSQETDLSVLDTAIAFRFEKDGTQAYFMPIHKPNLIDFDSLCNIDNQLDKVRKNTEAFAHGFLANNVLLTGARGTGKSSIVKACLKSFAHLGLRLIELDKKYLDDLPKIVTMLQNRTDKYLIFCDDLAFEAGDASYATLKTVLDGSLSAGADNTLIYATSNRKQMVVEYSRDNNELYTDNNGELRHSDTIEQKTSLADRFGLHIHFYGFSQDEYLNTVQFWLDHYGWQKSQDWESVRLLALQYATQQGNRSGRIANQFAKMTVGQEQLRLKIGQNNEPI